MACSVQACKELKRFRGENISFHLFPKDDDLKKEWIIAIGRDENWKPTKNQYVCSKHFLDSDYIKERKSRRPMLKPDAVPILFSDTKIEVINADDDSKQLSGSKKAEAILNAIIREKEAQKPRLEPETILILSSDKNMKVIGPDNNLHTQFPASRDLETKTTPNIKDKKTRKRKLKPDTLIKINNVDDMLHAEPTAGKIIGKKSPKRSLKPDKLPVLSSDKQIEIINGDDEHPQSSASKELENILGRESSLISELEDSNDNSFSNIPPLSSSQRSKAVSQSCGPNISKIIENFLENSSSKTNFTIVSRRSESGSTVISSVANNSQIQEDLLAMAARNKNSETISTTDSILVRKESIKQIPHQENTDASSLTSNNTKNGRMVVRKLHPNSNLLGHPSGENELIYRNRLYRAKQTINKLKWRIASLQNVIRQLNHKEHTV